MELPIIGINLINVIFIYFIEQITKIYNKYLLIDYNGPLIVSILHKA